MSQCPGVKWSGFHTVSTYHTAALTSDAQPAPGAEDCVVSEYVLNTISWNTHTRKLVNQSHGHFMSLQEQVGEERAKGGTISAQVLVHYSKLYRSALHECVLGLGADTSLSGGAVSQRELVSYYAMLELVWHLSEILFIELLPVGCLIQQLLEWVQRNGRPEEACLTELLALPMPETHREYWRVLYHLVMRGQLKEACKLLLAHSQAHTNPAVFESMAEVLSSAPMCVSTVGLSRGELHRRWGDWKREVAHRNQTGDYGTSRQLQLLARVLSGDEEAFQKNEIIESCDSWYELMVGKLLYTNPLVAPCDYDLPYCADWSMGAWRGVHSLWEAGTLDRLLEAAMRNDFMEVTTISSSESSDWWFVTHLSNLLMLKGLLTEQVLKSASKLCEFFVAEYGMGLLTLPSLWQVAMDYLSQCPLHGPHYMHLLLARVPLDSDKKADKVIHLCQRYNLKEHIKSVCKVMAMRAYKRGRLGAALTWCIRGKDALFVSFLVEKYMESFDSLGEFMDLDLLDHLGDAMLLSDRLMFLAKYREYHLLYERGELVKAGDLLVSLLLSASMPQRFLSTLLKDALGLLQEEKELVFSSEQTYTLSHFVVGLNAAETGGRPAGEAEVGEEGAEEDPQLQEKVKEKEKRQKELVSRLRLGLVKNLSRALMEESG